MVKASDEPRATTLPAPAFEDEDVTLYHGDALELLPLLEPADVCVTDPPYGDTSLGWDTIVADWPGLVDARQLWCFCSVRSLLTTHSAFPAVGWRYGQEVVWEKHTGSGFHADRFRRVHELAVHWYRGPWRGLYIDPPVTDDAAARAIRRKRRPPHTAGHIEAGSYRSEDGGPRLMRSVLHVPSEHGRAVHPTQKPAGVLRPLIHNSCPPGGVVLDPFAGSGSTLLAARQLGRRAVGVELDEGYVAAACGRLAQTELAGRP